MSVVVLYWLFLRATLLSFSGFASVPMIRDGLVLARGVLTDTQLNDAIAISQASPGPLGLYMVIVGYFVAGVPGAAAGILSLFTPALLAIPIARVVLRGQSAALRGACRGIVLVSCSLMLATGLRLAPEATPTAAYLVAVGAGFAVVALTNIKPVWVIVVSAGCGLVLK
jgi:chromate transporter